jgi:uncharacterized membrane protein
LAGEPAPLHYAGAGICLVLGVFFALMPAASTVDSGPPPTFAEVKAVVDQRCVLCHNAVVKNKGVSLHTPEGLKQNAPNVYKQAVVLRNMPQNNATQITEAERGVLRRWFESGATVP